MHYQTLFIVSAALFVVCTPFAISTVAPVRN
jgi:hypothetical protein